jgi:cytidyltransferase-like protein
MHPKIISIKQFLLLKKKNIGLCHGVFDVFHVGHKKHIESCKKKVSCLVVSVTADKYVNKGPGRPIFNEGHRAELISSLEFVDYVIINDAPTPVKLISELKPKYYFKGKDYSALSKDITKNIIKEKKEVEKHNGKLFFTDDIIFSSSSIINKNFGQKNIISELKKNITDFSIFKKNCFTQLDKLKKLKIAVIGETIIDQYTETEDLSKPSKENIIAVEKKNSLIFLGGALAVAINLTEFVKKIDFYSAGNLKKKTKNLLFSKIKKYKNINLIYDFKSSYHSVLKKRYINNNKKKLFEVYEKFGTNCVYNDKYLENSLKKNIKNYDVVIICDFGHGLFNDNIIKIISKNSKYFCLNTQSNADNRGFNLATKYKKCNFLCIDEPELRLAMASRYENYKDLGKKIQQKLNNQLTIITRGSNGIYAISNTENEFELPAFETNPIDTMGAGDAVFGIISVLSKNCKDLKVLCLIGNIIGALKTNIFGHTKTIEKITLLKSIEHLLK